MTSVLTVKDATVIRDGKPILGPLTWSVTADERWVVLGPNGAGKSTLFSLISTQLHPTRGTVQVLDAELGKSDLFEVRPRIGFVSSALIDQIPSDERVLDLVMSSAYAIVGRWTESYDLWDESRALSLLTILGVRDLRERTFFTLSEGEKKRVLIARALMPNPELLLLDEPAAGLDLGGREDLLKRLSDLAIDPASPATVIITHHVEEIPRGTTHCLLIKDGKPIASGPIDEVLTSEHLTSAYNIHVTVTSDGGRYTAKAAL
jgi:iron complex transport system ATP-binding protein